jgi:hypothetical protein
VSYGDDGFWPAEADGDGFSLERFDLHDDVNSPSAWRRSSALKASPGFVSEVNLTPIVVLSEIYASSDKANLESNDWIEFQNTTDTAIDISGWRVTDSA